MAQIPFRVSNAILQHRDGQVRRRLTLIGMPVGGEFPFMSENRPTQPTQNRGEQEASRPETTLEADARMTQPVLEHSGIASTIGEILLEAQMSDDRRSSVRK